MAPRPIRKVARPRPTRAKAFASRPTTKHLKVVKGDLCATAWTDGSNGSSKSPNGAAAYTIIDNLTGEVIAEEAVSYKHGEIKWTSNDMEMAGILLCLAAAKEAGIDRLDIRSDSMWSVNIVNGDFHLKQEKFVPVVEAIHSLGSDFKSVTLKHVPREMNARADWLCRGATNQKRPSRIPLHST